MPSVRGDLKRASVHLKLELQMVASYSMGAVTELGSSAKAASALNCRASSRVPCFHF